MDGERTQCPVRTGPSKPVSSPACIHPWGCAGRTGSVERWAFSELSHDHDSNVLVAVKEDTRAAWWRCVYSAVFGWSHILSSYPLLLLTPQALAQAIREAREQHPDMSVTRVVVHKETELAEEGEE